MVTLGILEVIGSGEAYKKHFSYLAWASGRMDEKHNVRAVRNF